MAIEYDKIMWDTTKYVNPTNMNHMDDGIKAACDAVDNMEFNEKISWADYQALTPEEKRDGTIRFVTDYPNSATIIDDTVTTSTTRSWSAKKTNDEISAVNSNLSKKTELKYKDIEVAVDCEAGNIGTRGAQIYIEYGDGVTYESIVSIEIINIANSSEIIPLVFRTINRVYLNVYRCVTTAVIDNRVDLRIYYKN